MPLCRVSLLATPWRPLSTTTYLSAGPALTASSHAHPPDNRKSESLTSAISMPGHALPRVSSLRSPCPSCTYSWGLLAWCSHSRDSNCCRDPSGFCNHIPEMKNFVAAAFTALIASSTALKVLEVGGSQLNDTHFIEQGTNQTIQTFSCGAHQGTASEHFNRTVSRFHEAQKAGAIGARAAKVATRQTVSPSITAPLYMHILHKNSEPSLITQTMVDQQVAELKSVYKHYGVTLNYQNTSWTANDAWAVAAGSDQAACEQALRVGDYGALNLYFHTDLSGGNLGTCTLPSSVQKRTPPSLYSSDGCHINANTMPGGNMAGYNQGKTAVHETGHWLGLLHTFEGYSCSGTGDYILDTPMESQSSNGCPSKPSKDSCTGVTGVDPIHNYMDYSTDACYTTFTPNQVARIGSMWQQYRASAAT